MIPCRDLPEWPDRSHLSWRADPRLGDLWAAVSFGDMQRAYRYRTRCSLAMLSLIFYSSLTISSDILGYTVVTIS